MGGVTPACGGYGMGGAPAWRYGTGGTPGGIPGAMPGGMGTGGRRAPLTVGATATVVGVAVDFAPTPGWLVSAV